MLEALHELLLAAIRIGALDAPARLEAVRAADHVGRERAVGSHGRVVHRTQRPALEVGGVPADSPIEALLHVVTGVVEAGEHKPRVAVSERGPWGYIYAAHPDAAQAHISIESLDDLP